MGSSDRRRITAVVAVSAGLHLGLLGLLALQRPALKGPALPPPILDVTLAPFYLFEPDAKGRRARAPLRARVSRPLEGASSPIAPIYAAPVVSPHGAPGLMTGVGVADHPAPLPGAGAATLGMVLRKGGVGCATPDLPGMTQADRDRCLEKLGAGARQAAYKGLGLSKDKQAQLDAAAAAKDRYIKYRDAPLAPGLAPSDAPGGLTGLGGFPHEGKIHF